MRELLALIAEMLGERTQPADRVCKTYMQLRRPHTRCILDRRHTLHTAHNSSRQAGGLNMQALAKTSHSKEMHTYHTTVWTKLGVSGRVWIQNSLRAYAVCLHC